MQMLENYLFIDTLNVFSIKVRIHILIHSHIPNLIINLSS